MGLDSVSLEEDGDTCLNPGTPGDTSVDDEFTCEDDSDHEAVVVQPHADKVAGHE